MKKLDPIEIDDSAMLIDFAKREYLSSYPYLMLQLKEIIGQYEIYEKEKGNVLKLKNLNSINPLLARAMKNHYKNEVKGLEFISKIRNELSPEVCPMCGGPGGASEVDHVVPKEEFPELSFYSFNLVPACSCNNKKSTIYRGYGERVLHPYFDNSLFHRIVCLEYSGDIETPLIEISPVVGFLSDRNVKFHISNILEKSLLKTWKIRTWSNFYRRPSSFLGQLKKARGVINNDDIKEYVDEKFNEYDEIYGTPNNWFSMMFYGLSKNKKFLSGVAKRENELRERGYRN